MKNVWDVQEQQLLLELESLEGMGIMIQMDGRPQTAAKVAEDLQVNEVSYYMRDYVIDELGIIKELRFDRVDDKEAPDVKDSKGLDQPMDLVKLDQVEQTDEPGISEVSSEVRELEEPVK